MVDQFEMENKLQENKEIPEIVYNKSQISIRQILVYMVVFVLGFGSGYALRGWYLSSQDVQGRTNTDQEIGTKSIFRINLPENYTLPITYQDIGPKLVESGAVDYERFKQVYENAGQPLNVTQQAVLKQEVDLPIVIDQENVYFLLNLFWAFGLANDNPILTEGLMMVNGPEQVGRFASTGGWTIGTKPATELYARFNFVSLNNDQQARLEQVAQNVYRPCCDNPTHFPDCNHGMAMLGVLELLVSQDASEESMLEAAKYLNAFWFPQQTYEMATYMKMIRGSGFEDIDAREAVSGKFFSGSGFRTLHQWLIENNALDQRPGEGNSCGV